MEITRELINEAERTQKEMFEMIEQIRALRPKCTYEDLRVTYFLMKIAELKAEIKQLIK